MSKRPFGNEIYKKIIKKLSTLTYTEIFIVVSLSALMIFLIRYFGFKQEWRTIRIEVIKKSWTENYDPYGYRAPYWLSDKIRVGQIQKDKSGKEIARLVDFDDFERGGEEAELYLTVRLKAVLNKRTGQYTFNDKYNLDLGESLELRLNNILLVGQIVDNNVPANGYPSKFFEVTMIGRNIEPWVVDQIKPQDKVTNRANNEVVAVILNTKTQEPLNPIIGLNGYKSLQIIPNDRVKDLLVTARIRCYQEDGKWYFAGHQNLKIANGLYFYTDKVNLYGFEVINFKEVPNLMDD